MKAMFTECSFGMRNVPLVFLGLMPAMPGCSGMVCRKPLGERRRAEVDATGPRRFDCGGRKRPSPSRKFDFRPCGRSRRSRRKSRCTSARYMADNFGAYKNGPPACANGP